MDPQICFNRFRDAVLEGNFEKASEMACYYKDWTERLQAFPARDTDGATVMKLDPEQDRFLVMFEGIERWRNIYECAREP